MKRTKTPFKMWIAAGLCAAALAAGLAQAQIERQGRIPKQGRPKILQTSGRGGLLLTSDTQFPSMKPTSRDQAAQTAGLALGKSVRASQMCDPIRLTFGQPTGPNGERLVAYNLYCVYPEGATLFCSGQTNWTVMRGQKATGGIGTVTFNSGAYGTYVLTFHLYEPSGPHCTYTLTGSGIQESNTFEERGDFEYSVVLQAALNTPIQLGITAAGADRWYLRGVDITAMK